MGSSQSEDPTGLDNLQERFGRETSSRCEFEQAWILPAKAVQSMRQQLLVDPNEIKPILLCTYMCILRLALYSLFSLYEADEPALFKSRSIPMEDQNIQSLR